MSARKKILMAGWLIAGMFLVCPLLANASNEDVTALETADQLTMGALVQAVIVQNAGLDEMRAAAQAAEQRIVPAGALDDPFLSYSLAPQTLGGTVTPTGRATGLRQSVELSQALPWPGKLGLREDAARLQADAASETIQATHLRLVARSKAVYAQWYYIHEALKVNAENLDLLEELRKVAENRYAAGLTGQQDVLQAEVRIQELRRQRLDMVRIQEQVAAQINGLLNRTTIARVPPPSALPPMQEMPVIGQLQQVALNQHPELMAIKRMVSANEARTKLAQKEFLPDFRVFSAYNSLRANQDNFWTIGVGINLPIGQAKRRAAVSKAKADTLRYEFQLEDRRAQLLADLNHAAAALKQARDTYILYRDDFIPRTRENLGAARSEYGSGGGSFLDVITAEEQKLNAELGTQRARADYFIALAELERWAGGEIPDDNINNSTLRGQ